MIVLQLDLEHRKKMVEGAVAHRQRISNEMTQMEPIILVDWHQNRNVRVLYRQHRFQYQNLNHLTALNSRRGARTTATRRFKHMLNKLFYFPSKYATKKAPIKKNS